MNATRLFYILVFTILLILSVSGSVKKKSFKDKNSPSKDGTNGKEAKIATVTLTSSQQKLALQMAEHMQISSKCDALPYLAGIYKTLEPFKEAYTKVLVSNDLLALKKFGIDHRDRIYWKAWLSTKDVGLAKRANAILQIVTTDLGGEPRNFKPQFDSKHSEWDQDWDQMQKLKLKARDKSASKVKEEKYEDKEFVKPKDKIPVSNGEKGTQKQKKPLTNGKSVPKREEETGTRRNDKKSPGSEEKKTQEQRKYLTNGQSAPKNDTEILSESKKQTQKQEHLTNGKPVPKNVEKKGKEEKLSNGEDKVSTVANDTNLETKSQDDQETGVRVNLESTHSIKATADEVEVDTQKDRKQKKEKVAPRESPMTAERKMSPVSTDAKHQLLKSFKMMDLYVNLLSLSNDTLTRCRRFMSRIICQLTEGEQVNSSFAFDLASPAMKDLDPILVNYLTDNSIYVLAVQHEENGYKLPLSNSKEFMTTFMMIARVLAAELLDPSKDKSEVKFLLDCYRDFKPVKKEVLKTPLKKEQKKSPAHQVSTSQLTSRNPQMASQSSPLVKTNGKNPAPVNHHTAQLFGGPSLDLFSTCRPVSSNLSFSSNNDVAQSTDRKQERPVNKNSRRSKFADIFGFEPTARPRTGDLSDSVEDMVSPSRPNGEAYRSTSSSDSDAEEVSPSEISKARHGQLGRTYNINKSLAMPSNSRVNRWPQANTNDTRINVHDSKWFRDIKYPNRLADVNTWLKYRIIMSKTDNRFPTDELMEPCRRLFRSLIHYCHRFENKIEQDEVDEIRDSLEFDHARTYSVLYNNFSNLYAFMQEVFYVDQTEKRVKALDSMLGIFYKHITVPIWSKLTGKYEYVFGKAKCPEKALYNYESPLLVITLDGARQHKIFTNNVMRAFELLRMKDPTKSPACQDSPSRDQSSRDKKSPGSFPCMKTDWSSLIYNDVPLTDLMMVMINVGLFHFPDSAIHFLINGMDLLDIEVESKTRFLLQRGSFMLKADDFAQKEVSKLALLKSDAARADITEFHKQIRSILRDCNAKIKKNMETIKTLEDQLVKIQKKTSLPQSDFMAAKNLIEQRLNDSKESNLKLETLRERCLEVRRARLKSEIEFTMQLANERDTKLEEQRRFFEKPQWKLEAEKKEHEEKEREKKRITDERKKVEEQIAKQRADIQKAIERVEEEYKRQIQEHTKNMNLHYSSGKFHVYKNSLYLGPVENYPDLEPYLMAKYKEEQKKGLGSQSQQQQMQTWQNPFDQHPLPVNSNFSSVYKTHPGIPLSEQPGSSDKKNNLTQPPIKSPQTTQMYQSSAYIDEGYYMQCNNHGMMGQYHQTRNPVLSFDQNSSSQDGWGGSYVFTGPLAVNNSPSGTSRDSIQDLYEPSHTYKAYDDVIPGD